MSIRLETLTFDVLRKMEIGQSLVISVDNEKSYQIAPQIKYEYLKSVESKYGTKKNISLSREIVYDKNGNISEYRLILHRDADRTE